MTKDRTWKFWKSIITQCFFIPLLQKLHRYTLICSNRAPNFKAIHQSMRKLCWFQKRRKKKRKNMKKIRRTLKAHISGMTWRIQLKFGNGSTPPWGNSHRNFGVLLVREYWATDAWKRRFLYSCKIHTCLSRAPGFLGRMTHYSVSWSDNEMVLTCNSMYGTQSKWLIHSSVILWLQRRIYTFFWQKRLVSLVTKSTVVAKTNILLISLYLTRHISIFKSCYQQIVQTQYLASIMLYACRNPLPQNIID